MLYNGFSITALSLAVISFLSVASAQSCIWKNGQTATNYFACDPSASQSSCCLGGEACLANGLCYGSLGQIYRGACAGGWGNDTACPTQCNDQGSDGSWSNLVLCPMISGPQNTQTWWCGNSGAVTPCDEQATAYNPTKCQFFTLPLFGMLPEAIMPYAAENFPGCAVNQASVYSVTRQIENATGNSTSSSCNSTTATIHPAATATTCSCPGGSTGTLTANTSPQPCPNGAQIGEGVAIGLMAIIALCAAAWGLWERKQKKKFMASQTTSMVSAPQVYHHQQHGGQYTNGNGYPQYHHSKPAQLADDTTRAEIDSFRGGLPPRSPMHEMHG